jgi:chemotaxis protein MotA
MRITKIDRATFLGAVIAGVCVITGYCLEGGVIAQVLQPTAALIVLGGTAGAVLIQFPFAMVRLAFASLLDTLIRAEVPRSATLADLERFCSQARRQGVLSLDSRLLLIEDPFLQKSLTLAVDGFAAEEIRRIMELELNHQDERDAGLVRVIEAAAGFSPTMGIIGAVLGLVQVMQRITDLGAIGKGIAVAFVSTLYGIGVANLFFLPLAGKLKIRLRERQLTREMMLEGVLSIVEGVNPRELRERLRSFSMEAATPVTAAQARKPEMAAR